MSHLAGPFQEQHHGRELSEKGSDISISKSNSFGREFGKVIKRTERK